MTARTLRPRSRLPPVVRDLRSILKRLYDRKLRLKSHTWLENTPYYNCRLINYERKLFIRLATAYLAGNVKVNSVSLILQFLFKKVSECNWNKFALSRNQTIEYLWPTKNIFLHSLMESNKTEQTSLWYKMDLCPAVFNLIFLIIKVPIQTVHISGIRTWDVGIEGKCADHHWDQLLK